MPQKRKLQTKSTPARSEQSRDARFLFGLRQARDETASEFRDDLRSACTMGELRRDFASRLKRRCKTFPILLAGYAQTLCERGLGIEEVEGELENATATYRSDHPRYGDDVFMASRLASDRAGSGGRPSPR